MYDLKSLSFCVWICPIFILECVLWTPGVFACSLCSPRVNKFGNACVRTAELPVVVHGQKGLHFPALIEFFLPFVIVFLLFWILLVLLLWLRCLLTAGSYPVHQVHHCKGGDVKVGCYYWSKDLCRTLSKILSFTDSFFFFSMNFYNVIACCLRTSSLWSCFYMYNPE